MRVVCRCGAAPRAIPPPLWADAGALGSVPPSHKSPAAEYLPRAPAPTNPFRPSPRDSDPALLCSWISRAGRRKAVQWEMILGLFNEHWNHCKERGDKYPDVRVINATLSTLAKAGRLVEAMHLYDELFAKGEAIPDQYTFGSLLLACSRKGNSSQAWKVMELMKSRRVRPNSIVLMSLMGAVTGLEESKRSRYGKRRVRRREDGDESGSGGSGSSQWSAASRDALKVLDLMVEYGAGPSLNAINATLYACAKSGDWEGAVELLQSCQERYGIAPDPSTFAAVLHACDVSGKSEECESLLIEAQRDGKWPLSVEAFNCVLSALSHSDQWRKALLLLDSMDSMGHAPDEVSYNTCITACAKAGEWRTALELYETLKTIASSSHERGERGLSNWSHNAALSACALAQPPRWNEALTIFQEAKVSKWNDKPQSTIAYNTLISALGKAGRHDQAILYFEAMRSAKVRPNVKTYTALIGSCARARPPLPRRAVALIDEMKRNGVRPNEHTYSTALKAVSKGRDPEAPLKLLQSMRDSGISPNGICYVAALGSLDRLGAPPDTLLAVWRDMKRHDLSMRAGDSYAVGALQRLGKWSEALEILESDSPLLREALEALAAAQSNRDINLKTARAALAAAAIGGQVDCALTILRQMSVPPDALCYGSVLAAHSNAERYAGGLDILEEMLAAGYTPDAAAYSAAVRCCRGAGQWARAIELHAQAVGQGIRPTKQMVDDVSFCSQQLQ